MTIKGSRILKEADVVVYDRLIPAALVKLIPRSAEKIYVGKRAGCHTISQTEVNRIIVESARSGKDVVRLKGGEEEKRLKH